MEQQTAHNTVPVCISTPKTWPKPLWSVGVTGAAFLSGHITPFPFLFQLESRVLKRTKDAEQTTSFQIFPLGSI